jgi:signal peptidase II
LKIVLPKVGIRFVLALLVVTTIGCDRVTKHIASTTLAGRASRSFLVDSVRLEYAENTGGFLGLGADLPVTVRAVLFIVATGLALLGMTALAIRLRNHPRSLIALSLFIGGGASNLADRIAFGSVVDFINVGVGSLRTGIFNVADVAIMLGCALLLVSELNRSTESHAEPRCSQTPNKLTREDK